MARTIFEGNIGIVSPEKPSIKTKISFSFISFALNFGILWFELRKIFPKLTVSRRNK